MGNNSNWSVAFLGATVAVGSECMQQLIQMDVVGKISSFGRRKNEKLSSSKVSQFIIEVSNSAGYASLLKNHDTAICTLGVGQPSKVSREQFIKIDKTAVLDFATACKAAGIKHFELLSSVAISAQSRDFFLRTKGELVEALIKLNFERLSIFQPSMILTPNNRYGIMQGITLTVWPWLSPILMGSLKKFRGVKVEILGKSMALNLSEPNQGLEYLYWSDFMRIAT